MRPERTALLLLLTASCAGPAASEVEDENEVTGGQLTSGERALLSSSAKLWRTSGELAACDSFVNEEDFSSGRYNVHRYALSLHAGGTTVLRLERSAGSWSPALIVGTRGGTAIFRGDQSSSAAGVEAAFVTSGRLGDVAEVHLDASSDLSVDVYVTAWASIDATFTRSITQSAEYRLSAVHTCEAPMPNGNGWRGIHDGLTQGGASIPRAGLSNATLRRALGVAVEPYGNVVTREGFDFVHGTVSTFGGPNDTGVTASETGAISGERLRSLNSPLHPDAATLRNNPASYYFLAMRFDYTNVGIAFWRDARILIRNPANDSAVVVRAVDWGPNTRTGRLVDLSPQVMVDLGIQTDDAVDVSFARNGSPLGPVE